MKIRPFIRLCTGTAIAAFALSLMGSPAASAATRGSAVSAVAASTRVAAESSSTTTGRASLALLKLAIAKTPSGSAVRRALAVMKADPAEPRILTSLKIGQTLGAADLLVPSATSFTFLVGYGFDGSLTEYSLVTGKMIFSTHTPGSKNVLTFQHDGNVVLRDAGATRWATHTTGRHGTKFSIAGNGDLVVTTPGATTVYSSHSGITGVGSVVVFILVSPDGHYGLISQADGNVVIYFAPNPNADVAHSIWSTHTPGYAAPLFVLQSDGNLVLRTTGTLRWSSRTSGHPGSTVTMQSDGNLVLRDHAGKAFWTSNTAGKTESDPVEKKPV